MEIKINVSAPEMVEAINNLAAALTIGKESTSTKTSRSKASQVAPATPAATTPEPVQQPVQQPAPVQAPTPVQQCGDCNTYTPDPVLTSVGNCNNPVAPTPVNGFVPTAQPACNEYQQPMQPVQYPQTPPQAPVQQAPVNTPQPPVAPTTAPTYTLEQLSLAATQLVDAGRVNEVRALVGSYGIPALTALPKDKYSEFAFKLREMGAKL
ncbi:MAG TPA: hypothetical protein VIO64_10840 [Pseudobacteroides sp.]|uniref:hypothetical protein n=1 Tax=Pseudobacteroides sp. TaxID=1968840 RepID=UPI002F94C9ED